MTGSSKTIKTGNSPSALSILTLNNATISASGLVTIEDNFWAMFGTGGSFSTNNNNVYANQTLICDGGTINVNGGSLVITNGSFIGYNTNNGNITISNGDFETDAFTLGSTSHTGTFTQSGGTSNFTGDVNILNGSFTISDGTSIASSNISIGDGTETPIFTVSGGVFTVSNQKLYVNSTLNISGGITNLYGLDIGSGTLSGNLNHTNGTVNILSKRLKIFSTSNYICAGSPILNIYKNFVVNGSFIPDNSTVTFAGNFKSLIKSNSKIDFYNLALNTTDTVELEEKISVSGTLSLIEGILLSTEINSITILDGAISSIGSQNSYVEGPIFIEKASAGSSTLLLPTGKQTYWRPIELTVNHTNSTSYTYKAEMFNASAAAKGWELPATVDNVSGTCYWSIKRYNSADLTTEVPSTDLSGNQTVTLYYGNDDGVIDASSLSICKGTSASATWIDIGGMGATNFTGSVTSTSSPSAFTSFSDFTLANGTGGANPLPIELSEFTAFKTQDGIKFNWVTKSEKDNDYFTLEKSFDGITFSDIDYISGAGTTPFENSYSYLDESEYTGVVYFRLKQTDFDGKQSTSPVLAITLPETAINIIIYPNPASDYINIETKGITIKNINIYNSSKQNVYYENSYDETINISNLPQGTYFMRISTESSVFVKKFIKN